MFWKGEHGMVEVWRVECTGLFAGFKWGDEVGWKEGVGLV